MKFETTKIPGCLIVSADVKNDSRGHFVKTFHAPSFEAQGISFTLKESFFTLSKKNVLRGFHFQVPPSDHAKLVYCASGEILDMVIDIRKKSPTFGQALSVDLTGENGKQIYIPKGLAHAFLTKSEGAVVVYGTTHPYSPENDKGLHWQSSPLSWPNNHPLVSDRDNAFPRLEKFDSPFMFTPS